MGSIPRFLLPSEALREATAFLSKKESRHAISVLRLKRGDAVDLFDGKGKRARGVVLGPEKGLLKVTVGKRTASPVSSGKAPRFSLMMALVKSDRMEWVIQKACELGVYEILPVVSDRCVVRWKEKNGHTRWERWERILSASCKQCGRDDLPLLRPVRPFRESLVSLKTYDAAFLATLALSGQGLCGTLEKSKPGSCLALVGPEGDFTEEEAALAVVAGAQPVHLGSLVLRSETAALYLLSAIGFYLREIKAHAKSC